MAKIAGQTIAGGAWIEVQLDGTPIGLASGVTFNEDFRVQPIEVLNVFGVKEYESFGYMCQLSMEWFIAKDKADYDRLIPHRSELQKSGLAEDHVLSFVDTSTGNIFQSFSGAVIASAGVQIRANQMVTGDVTMFAKERQK